MWPRTGRDDDASSLVKFHPREFIGEMINNLVKSILFEIYIVVKYVLYMNRKEKETVIGQQLILFNV